MKRNFESNSNKSNSATPVYGSPVAGIKKVEGRVLTQDCDNYGHKVVSNTNLQPSKRMYVDIDWLPAASSTYQISPDIKDYIIVPVPIITSDLPNRNLQGWPLSEIVYFDPMHGKPIYRTFQGKPTHIDHQNENPREAKGVIFDATLHPIPKYGVSKILVLTGWDRTKDSYLARQILNGERDSYSMGCLVNSFVCSICNTPYSKEGGRACMHQLDPHQPIVQIIGGRLNYMNCYGDCFFETSSVQSPADPSAVSGNDNIMTLI